MTYKSSLFRSTALLLVSLLQVLMLVRAVMSWFPQVQGSKLYQFVYMLTEPIIMPIQALLDKLFPSLRYFPLSISFLLAYMLLIALEMMLY